MPRRSRKPRDPLEPRLYAHIRNKAGWRCSYPLRYLSPAERADFLARATSPLAADGVAILRP